jgi:hypothetical protein
MAERWEAAADAAMDERDERASQYAHAFVLEEFGKSASYVLRLAEQSQAVGDALQEVGRCILTYEESGGDSQAKERAIADLNGEIAAYELNVLTGDRLELGRELGQLHAIEALLRQVTRQNHNARRLGRAQTLIGELIEELGIARRSGVAPAQETEGAALPRSLVNMFRQYAEHHEAWKAEEGTLDREAWTFLQRLGQ